MLSWLLFAAYAVCGIVTGTVMTHVHRFSWDDEEVVLSVPLWPITVIIYGTKRALEAPQTVRDFKQHKLATKRRLELEHEQHKTRLQAERTKRAEIQRQEYDALGIPAAPLDP